MENELGTKKINSLLISYGIPAIASSLITSVYNLIDQIFIGQKIGYLGNAATQVVYPVTILCGALALLFGIGGSVLFNIMQGKGNKEGQRHSGYVLMHCFLYLERERPGIMNLPLSTCMYSCCL